MLFNVILKALVKIITSEKEVGDSIIGKKGTKLFFFCSRYHQLLRKYKRLAEKPRINMKN